MKKFKVGDYVAIRFALWDGWMKIEAVNKGLFGTKYIAYVKWSDVGYETYIFRRWRIKAWL